MKNTTQQPLKGTDDGLVQLIREENSIWLKWVKRRTLP